MTKPKVFVAVTATVTTKSLYNGSEVEWRSGGFKQRSGGLVESGGCVELEVLEVEWTSGGLVGSRRFVELEVLEVEWRSEGLEWKLRLSGEVEVLSGEVEG